MFVGYQGDLVVLVTETKEEITENKFTVCDRIEESDKLWKLVNGRWVADEELSKAEAELQIAELKRLLQETDYIASKIAEGAATKMQYAREIAQRELWRKEIREAEKCLNKV